MLTIFRFLPMSRKIIFVLFAFFNFCVASNAQKFAVKTNGLYLATATPNVGVEAAIGERWTVEIEGGYNPWTFDKEKNVKAKHWLVSPEFRYWFCNSFQGHFIGINGNYAQFNAGALPVSVHKAFISLDQTPGPDLEKSRAEGWAVGVGLTYGYAFPIARRWNMEFTAGFGYWYTVYNRYESRKCGLFQETVNEHALGPTSLGISFIYMIK